MTKEIEVKTRKAGYYFNLSGGEFLHLEKGEVTLGSAAPRLIGVPMGVLILAGPVIGFFYVLFLPFAGIAAIIWYTGYRLVNAITMRRKATPVTK